MTDETPKAYKTLEALVEENLEAVKEAKLRPYKVTAGDDKPIYVLTNSSGNAALAACKVETCTQKQIKTAAFDVLLKKAKADDEAKP